MSIRARDSVRAPRMNAALVALWKCSPKCDAGKASAANSAYLPNNPLSDFAGFCTGDLLTIPLAALFSIFPMSAWMDGFDAVPVIVSGMPPFDPDLEPLPNNPLTVLLTTPPTADKAAIFAFS